ncbi:ABC-F family ATP-binding cassette domain-containing protein [Mitsuokella sp. oral taxon 131]|uniref:ABC-F family ATP-binding cassette domain-containing protein n=1 Tax=Mitsuokella sp. oral taxon 131 TaxID=1321780 RepID=UPI0003AE7237|nr:ATP-binding cassette domain-containing protein [Mitsuokella sp. oral taxon 131]ERL05920.1 ABC transporter, ATP-binding protein [Mitsuokella sp. oral taxon 131 str. W9106]
MITTNNVSLQFGKRVLYKDVNLKFTLGNCYGIIGANGAGKSTFLKLLSGAIEPTGGVIEITPGERLSVLQQDHYAFDGCEVLRTVIMGNRRLVEIMDEKEALYAKPDFSDADGMRASELETEFAEMNGWDAETEAARLLNGLGIPENEHAMRMADLPAAKKVRVLLAQALFGSPDILLLDEPTNHLDVASINWLEEFLAGFPNTVIVVSHDRHFLNQVCTYICDVDFGEIRQYAGNYDFWYQSSQLALQMAKDANKKKEEKIKELQTFIQRFAANAAKSKQATSRKKLLEKITLDDIKPSSRRYPYIAFTPDREAGDQLLQVTGLSKTVDGEQVLKNVSFTLKRGDKVAFVGPNGIGKTMLFKILMGEEEPDEGTFKWGVTTTQAYLPTDNSAYFDDVGLNLVDWLRQYSKDPDETFVRGFLGRMLFSGEESQKKASVLSGGERVRCMLSRMMLSGANVLLLDEPTNHLDLESITALNNGLIAFTGTVLFVSHDHEFVQTIANRIIDITPDGVVDRVSTYDDFLANETVKQQIAEKYGNQ